MTGQESPETPVGHAAPSLGSNLVASTDSGESLEVSQLYAGVKRLLDATTSDGRRVGDCKHGVYLFVDYDGEPIYVGQTREKLRIRSVRGATRQGPRSCPDRGIIQSRAFRRAFRESKRCLGSRSRILGARQDIPVGTVIRCTTPV